MTKCLNKNKLGRLKLSLVLGFPKLSDTGEVSYFEIKIHSKILFILLKLSNVVAFGILTYSTAS